MSTRSYIAEKQPDDTFKYIYCHFDGYPGGVGQTLLNHFNDEDRVSKLITLGSLSYLGKDIDSPNDFDNPNPDKDVTMAYHRDRGEYLEINESTDLEELLEDFDQSWTEYLYIFENDSWVVKKGNDKYFKELKEILC